MTPLEYAQDLRGRAESQQLPDPLFAQLGDIVVDCAGTWFTVTNVSQQELVPGEPVCGIVDMGDVQITTAFECSIVSDDEGITDPKKLTDVAAQQDILGKYLTEIATDEIAANNTVAGTFGGISYQNTGGLGVVTVSFTVPIP